MSEKENTLLTLYLDDIAYARHHENLRASMTNMILAVGAAISAVIGLDDKVSQADEPAAVLLILLGVVGMVFSYKHYERFHSHYARARNLRKKLEEETGIPIVQMKDAADNLHKTKFPRSHKWSLKYFWMAIPACVALVGVLVLGEA